jgi:hypothetical protein
MERCCCHRYHHYVNFIFSGKNGFIPEQIINYGQIFPLYCIIEIDIFMLAVERKINEE